MALPFRYPCLIMMPKQHGSRMDTTWLADLKALSETLNFSRAAQIRNITQPAFGRRIRALEAWCGVSLVERGSHRLSLTPAGTVMLDAAGDVLRRLDRARDDIDQAQTATLTFAATHALSFTFFPAWIKGLGTGAATQPMRLLSDNMIRCERMMRAGEAQFLLCHHHVVSPTCLPEAGFDHVVLARDRIKERSGDLQLP
jgi:LysR family transcriptional regulator, hypochlorite-specific transcription factor HypT